MADILFGLLFIFLIYQFVGFMIWLMTGHQKEVILLIYIWPYVIYVQPEGNDWYYRKIRSK